MEIKDETPLVAWMTMNNIFPIIVSFISIGISIGFFWYNMKLEINEVKGQGTLTNQKLDQVIAALKNHSEEADVDQAKFNDLALKVKAIETLMTYKGQ